MGYLSLRSPCPCSRNEAPLAQWEPRFIGESKSGSWPVHTPFCTSAMTPQPTEQWVHTERRISVLTPSLGALSKASARRIMENGRVPANAPPPMASPERRRKVRRSMLSPLIPNIAASTESEAGIVFRFLINFIAALLDYSMEAKNQRAESRVI